ncbi:uncharacterized protein PpBr36_06068 [Pyricularia pennisetigena]|uniref:uncharacterized protein n=1 Tax=Pyricularia pennisetigena TaxID=1578925 RepID=UPI00114EA846|nr:uncharacterized protein PpBr36_06068 [Pyricularia pennisetigena]TLS22869.1 hypothetical protein PpBr36_06068 [Pyricularia pennisetigena]
MITRRNSSNRCTSAGRITAQLLLSFLAFSVAPTAASAPHDNNAHEQFVLPLPQAPLGPLKPEPPAPAGHTFTLRHIYHHGTHKHPRLHRKQDVHQQKASIWLSAEDGFDKHPLPVLTARSRPGNIERLVDRRPSVVEPMVAQARERGFVSVLSADAWTVDAVSTPDVTDRDTVVNLAYMAANAYVETPDLPDWEEVGESFNRSADFGWESDGLRGHIFADENNSTIVIGLKGTSLAVFDGEGTTTNDKENDNLFFSCCCAQQGQWTWRQVCDCATSSYACNVTCVSQSLREENRYYMAARELYSNVTELYPTSNIWLTGHSLGGAVSSFLGLTYGLPAVTFQAVPEALAAGRLGLPVPPSGNPELPQTRENTGVYHFGHTADPIYVGTCNGATASCSYAGYALETKCHAGHECIYDVVADKGWRVGVGTHKIRTVINDVLLKYDEVPECKLTPKCRDCELWKMYESNGTESTTTSSSSTTSKTMTRTETCKTPGWWGCLDETTTTTSTTMTTTTSCTTTTSTTSTCKTPGWFGCKDKTTSATTTSTSSIPTATTTCETPGKFWGCNDKTTTTEASHTPTPTPTQHPITAPPQGPPAATSTPSSEPIFPTKRNCGIFGLVNMATDLEVPTEAPPRHASPSDSDSSDDHDADDSGGGASAADSPVEWLATGRARRSTAGNRMKSMIAQEAAAAGVGGDEGDSDLELLFAEADDDEGFSDNAERDDGSDAQMDSSSDDDDDAKEGDDELEGEKELERIAKEKRAAAKKRKAQQAIPAKFRKRVRIESTPSTRAGSEQAAQSSSHHLPRRQVVPAPPPRPKKKSERTSWLPSASDMPTRASERSTTRMSKEQLHQQMVEREVRRKKQLEQQEKKAKRLELLKKPPMTQADRLREAELVEKRNSKSLNRWEEAEKQREEERERKLAALYNRTLEGPVVTFWTGIMELSEGQMKNVGRMVAMEEKAPRRKKQPAATAPAASISTSTEKDPAAAPSTAVSAATATEVAADQQMKDAPPVATEQTESAEKPIATPALAAPVFHQAVFQPIDLPTEKVPAEATTTTLPSSVLAPPVSMMAPPMGAVKGPMQMPGLSTNSGGVSNVLAPPNSSQGESSLVPPTLPPPTSTTAVTEPVPKKTETTIIHPQTTQPPPQLPPKSSSQAPKTISTQKAEQDPSPTKDQDPTVAKTEPESSVNGRVTRSCIVLQNFDEEAIKDKTVQTQILFGRKFTKLAKPGHAPHCVITNHLAKYRDPKTGLPFANMNAYKAIRRLTEGNYKWSSILGTWVGTGELAAKGVPNRFLHGGPKEESPPPPTPEAQTASSLPAVPPHPAEPKVLPATPAQAAKEAPNIPSAHGSVPGAIPAQAPVTSVVNHSSSSGNVATTSIGTSHMGVDTQTVPPLRPVLSTPTTKVNTSTAKAPPKITPQPGPATSVSLPTPAPKPQLTSIPNATATPPSMLTNPVPKQPEPSPIPISTAPAPATGSDVVSSGQS